ncbi:hypothetical protein JTE90_013278 [Oedothorax gibbosus]|uniref:Metalloendopeptidase n=1 Tax=Oedothorax gibbosus TaxID=931172 RepID=A0AAV6VD25_9ARAC|nr:hypothetical protein JTE90_013278 [Oedothorax gibbosus]
MKKLAWNSWILFLGIVCKGSISSAKSLPGILMEGDIMFNAHEDPWDRQRGPLMGMGINRWPSAVVPFKINNTAYYSWDLQVLEAAFKEIEKFSCITFVERTNEQDYLFITPYEGCWSFIGRQGSEQVLSLTTPHCINKGTIVHELLHALGLWHEHSRSDRDEYIDILWNNVVDREKQANFAKHFPEASHFLSFPYDYQSVMHYDAFAFSKSPQLPTMTPKKPIVRMEDLGRAKKIGTLTETDKRKINTLYECKRSEI